MVSSEAQRTLVKSPPELWAELSDPVALARHFGEFGEIRITRTDPEKKVEWESQDVRGTVELAPSGWGTKVSLTAVRELPAASELAAIPEQSATDVTGPEQSLEHGAELLATAELSTDAASALPELPATELQPELTPEPTFEPEPASDQTLEADFELDLESDIVSADELPQPTQEEVSATESRRGFFARLFRRGRKQQSAELEAEREPGAELELAAVEIDSEQLEHQPLVELPVAEQQLVEQFQAAQPHAETVVDHDDAVDTPMVPSTATAAVSDLAAELLAAEELATEQATAVLVAVLDRLGAAHHRPFSRA